MPFIARYRKEATGSLDDAQLRDCSPNGWTTCGSWGPQRRDRWNRSRGQGKLTDALAAQIAGAETKARLEDIYLPFKPKRRTKAQIARRPDWSRLADGLLGDPDCDPNAAAAGFVDVEKGVADADAALAGARAILTERFGEDADLVGELREVLWQRGRLVATVRDAGQAEGRRSSPTTSTSPSR